MRGVVGSEDSSCRKFTLLIVDATLRGSAKSFVIAYGREDLYSLIELSHLTFLYTLNSSILFFVVAAESPFR